MNIYSEPGTIVVFSEPNVTEEQINWGGNDDPAGILVVGKKYTIERTEVHSYHTKVFLKEFPGKKFNCVWFKEAK